MVHTYVKLPIHGDLEHFNYLSIASYICWKRGFEFLDPSGFAYRYKTPGIPDIYIRYQRKMKDQHGTRPYDKYAVIEVETHANTKDTEKKTSQFESSAMNVQLIIIPMNKFDKWKAKEESRGKTHGTDVAWINEFMSLYIPEKGEIDVPKRC